MQKITPCIWFDNQAEEAAKLYTSIFKKSKVTHIARYGKSGSEVSGIKEGKVMTVDFQINGQNFLALNGGPIFKLNPSISFFAFCKTAKEVDEIFNKLSPGGKVMMALDKYPFSERFAFIEDKFGVSWQIMLSSDAKGIVPCFLFVGNSLGKAEEAIKFYTKNFKNSKIKTMVKYGKGQAGPEGTVMHSSFILDGQDFSAMDGAGPHKFAFNESVSFMVSCNTQQEIDKFWKNLSEGGQESQCGWLKDKFGVSWQIIPNIMGKLMTGKDPKKTERVMSAMLKMKKLDIKALTRAYNESKD